MKNRKKVFSFKDVAVIVVIASVIMYFLGGLSTYTHLGGINYSLLGSDSNLQEFISAYENLLDNYYDDLDKSKVISGAINGMYNVVGDPYTTYLDTTNTINLNDTLNGQYKGIGIRIETTDEFIRIVEVFEDSPAFNVGLKEGDIITKVNGQDVSMMSGTDVANMIKSSDGDISIEVNRDETTLTYNLNTAELMVPVVTSQALTKDSHNIGYIGLSVFNDTADVQFESALSSLEASGIESLIIDLRYNSGGYLSVAKNIAEMFLKKGDVIYYLENKNSKKVFKDSTKETRNYNIVVLVNNSSASASEILAAALKYSHGATLIGEKTYGKGKVQERTSLSNGTTLKYTTAKWLTPNGDCIDGIGLKPDYEVTFDLDTYITGDVYTDSQLLYALENLAD